MIKVCTRFCATARRRSSRIDCAGLIQMETVEQSAGAARPGIAAQIPHQEPAGRGGKGGRNLVLAEEVGELQQGGHGILPAATSASLPQRLPGRDPRHAAESGHVRFVGKHAQPEELGAMARARPHRSRAAWRTRAGHAPRRPAYGGWRVPVGEGFASPIVPVDASFFWITRMGRRSPTRPM